jgi:hypothetical protein
VKQEQERSVPLQTLKQARELIREGDMRKRFAKRLSLAACRLDGLHEGDAKLREAFFDIDDWLPFAREYTVEEFVNEFYTIDSTDRYRCKQDDE